MNSPILILAGIDPSGGAGIIADIKTASELGVFAYAIPTIFTNQNSFIFKSKKDVEYSYIIDSYKTISEEKKPEYVKIGYIPHHDPEWLRIIKQIIINKSKVVVIDPVLKPTSSENIESYVSSFTDFISSENGNKIILTPNKKELENIFAIANIKGTSFKKKAINFNNITGSALVIKFETEKEIVMVVENSTVSEIPVKIIKTEKEIHGTGCRFSTALLSFLFNGYNLIESAQKTAEYMTFKIKENSFLLSEKSNLIIN